MKLTQDLGHDIAQLPTLTVTQLRQRYADLFGEITQVGNKQWLVKRIAWRWQAQAEGDLSERARQRALHLANDADLRLNPPKVLPELPAPELRFGVLHPRGDLGFEKELRPRHPRLR